MPPETITDPVLGDEGRLFGDGNRQTGIFTKEFGPTQGRISILVDVVNSRVPQAQRDLYQKIEAWYPTGVQTIFQASLREIQTDPALAEWASLDKIQNHFQLTAINIRYPFHPPAQCVFEYRFDPNAPKWYVRLAEDYQVEWCGLGD